MKPITYLQVSFLMGVIMSTLFIFGIGLLPKFHGIISILLFIHAIVAFWIFDRLVAKGDLELYRRPTYKRQR